MRYTKLDEYNLSRQDWENMIDSWIFDERDRKILKRKLLDGISHEQTAEEFSLTARQVKNIVKKGENKLFKHI